MSSDQPKAATTERMPQRDRRQCTRFKLRGSAWYSWESPDGRTHEGEGITGNLGKAGVFIETQIPPQVAAPIRVVVTLAAKNHDMQARLCGIGEVRHVSSTPPENSGFGASVVFRTEAPAEAG